MSGLRSVSRRRSEACLVAIAAVVAIFVSPGSTDAATYTWLSATTGGLWSDTTLWSPTPGAGGPTTGDVVILDTTASETTRTVTITSAANLTVGTLTITQTNSGTNTVDIGRTAYTVTNAVTLNASNGGTARIFLNPQTTGTASGSTTFTGGVAVNSGGMLSMGQFNPSGTNASYSAQLTGAVTVSGGGLVLEPFVKNGTNNTSNQSYITGAVTMTSGSLTIFNTSIGTGATSNDRRLRVGGNLSITGGTVFAQHATSGGFYLDGATNTFKPAVMSGTSPQMVLQASSAQSLLTNQMFTQFMVRGTGVKTYTSEVSGTNMGNLTFVDENTATPSSRTTFKLGSNLTLASGRNLPATTNLGSPEPTTLRVDVGIDADAYTFDMTANSGVFTPNTAFAVGSGTTTYWQLSGTAGRIVANGFKFDTSGVAVSVGPGLVLESKAGNGIANVLNVGSGTGSLTIDPASIFRYSGAAAAGTPSTLTSSRSIGDLEVTSGALRVTTLAGLQAVRVSGGTLDLGGNALTVTSGSFGGNVTSGTLTSGTFLASSGTLSASLDGTGSLVKSGAGTLILSGTNSYTGGTTINGGLVQVGSAEALSTTGSISFGGGGIAYTSSNTTDYSARFSTEAGQLYNVNLNGQSATWATSLTSGGASALTRAGNGLLTLTGPATAIGSGGITINGGTTVIDPGEGGTFSTTGRVRIGDIAGAATVTLQSGSINLTPASNVYIGMADNSTGTSTLNVAGGVVTLGLSNTRLMVGNKGPGTINVTNGLLEMTGGNPIYIGGDSQFTQSNANGTLTIAGGTVSIPSAGTFSIGNSGSAGNTNTGVAGTLNLNGGELRTARAITTSTLGSSPATSTVNFNGGVLTALASSTSFLRGLTTASVQNGGASINTNSFDITISQSLLGTGTGGLTKSGAGVLTLSGSNTFTGETAVSAGTLVLAASSALGQSVYDTASAGTLSFGSLTAVSLGGLKGSGNVVLANTDSAAVDLSVGGSAASSTYSGTISGAGSLAKVGSGTFTITGSQSYTGGTSIIAGALQIGNAGTTGAVTGSIVNNGTLIFNRSVTSIVSNGISGSGLVVHAGGGSLTLSGSNTYSGGTVVNGAGVLLVHGADQVGSGTITLRTTGTSTAAVLSLNGVTVNNPIVLDQVVNNRNNVAGAGDTLLAGPISITGSGNGQNIFAANAASTMTISGSMTSVSTYTNNPSFRPGTGATIAISGMVNFANSGFDLNGGTGTVFISSTGNVWSTTIFQGSGVLLRLGADNALPTAASLSISSNSTGGGLDLNGFGQTVPGFTSTSSTTSIPLARIFNNAATDSTLTLAGMTADRSATVALADGTGGGKVALVMNSAGRTQTLASATSSYTGGTTIVAGTIALGHGNGLGGGGPLAVNGGGLDLRGFSPTVGALSGSATGLITSGTAGAATFTVSSASDSTFAGLIENGLGTVGLTKAGSGSLTLTAAHTYTGPTNVNGGRLAVDGSLASAVTVGLGGEIGGSGSVGALDGAGLVGPGNSPGILTAPSVDPSGGLDFAFEFTQASPNYANATASDNDLLWLTDTVTPFAGSLTGANTVSIYLTQSAAALSELTGGFFTAAAGDFFASISGATFQYFVQDAAGTFSYNGQAYKTLAQYDPSKSISVSTVGANGGQVMQLVVVPEPGAIVLAGVGAAIAAWACRRGKMPPR